MFPILCILDFDLQCKHLEKFNLRQLNASAYTRNVFDNGGKHGLKTFIDMYLVMPVTFPSLTTVTWLKYCRYGVKHYSINQSTDFSFYGNNGG